MSGIQIVQCKLCDGKFFRVIYDPKAQGCHAECADCGTVCLRLVSA